MKILKQFQDSQKKKSLAHTKKVTELNDLKEQYTKLIQGKDGHQKTVVPYDSLIFQKIRQAARKSR